MNGYSRESDNSVPFAFDFPPLVHDLRIYALQSSKSPMREHSVGYTARQLAFMQTEYTGIAHDMMTLIPAQLQTLYPGIRDNPFFPSSCPSGRVPLRISAVMALADQ